MGMTLAIFSLSGYIPVVRERLKIFTNEGARMGRDSLIKDQARFDRKIAQFNKCFLK